MDFLCVAAKFTNKIRSDAFHIADGIAALIHGVADLGLHQDVGDKAVEEEVRKSKETVDVYAAVSGNIPEFFVKSGESVFGATDLVFGIAHLSVLDKVGDKTAADYVPDSPTSGFIQFSAGIS